MRLKPSYRNFNIMNSQEQMGVYRELEQKLSDPGLPARQEEWKKLVKPYDIKVMSVAENRADKYNILHLCGEPEYQYLVHLDRFADYPGAMINWAIYPNHYSLERGRDLFERPVMGGLDNHGVMAHGSDEEVRQAVCSLIDRYGGAGYMLGADCSIESAACAGRIRKVVETAKEFRLQ